MQPLMYADVMLIQLARCWAVIDFKADLPQRDGKTFSASVRAWANRCWHVSTNLINNKSGGRNGHEHTRPERGRQAVFLMFVISGEVITS